MIDEFAYVTPAMWVEREEEILGYVQHRWDGVPLLNISGLRDLHNSNNRLVKYRGMVQDVLTPEPYYDVYDAITKEGIPTTMMYSALLPYQQHGISYPTDTPNLVKQRLTFIVTTIPGMNQWVRTMVEDIAIPINSIPERSQIQKRSEQSLTLQNPPPKCCHVSLYKDADKVKISDLVEFVGFLSIYDTAPQRQGSDKPMDVQTDYPPPTLVVRIHCIAFKKIDHSSFLACYSYYKPEAYRLRIIKQVLHLALHPLMLGDTLATEYLVYHLISKVYDRNETLPLGKFCLNISHIPLSVITQFVKHVYEFIELFVPTSQYVAMTVENLNRLPFIPRKNLESDRLVRGLLQVSNNTHIVLDETQLEPEQLTEAGTEAISALGTAIKYQKVEYKYHNHSVDFDCDIPFLILSKEKSLLPSDFHIRLEPLKTRRIYQEPPANLHPLANNIRHYLTQTRYQNFVFDDDIMKQLVESDFARWQQMQSISRDDLHQLLALSRLIALSDGKTKLDARSWNKALVLEQERKWRINSSL